MRAIQIPRRRGRGHGPLLLSERADAGDTLRARGARALEVVRPDATQGVNRQACTGDELRVIAAAVIGGTSPMGGIGTIPGAILGAVVIQSLQSGMTLLGADSSLQNIATGIVLVIAVFLDMQYQRRRRK